MMAAWSTHFRSSTATRKSRGVCLSSAARGCRFRRCSTIWKGERPSTSFSISSRRFRRICHVLSPQSWRDTKSAPCRQRAGRGRRTGNCYGVPRGVSTGGCRTRSGSGFCFGPCAFCLTTDDSIHARAAARRGLVRTRRRPGSLAPVPGTGRPRRLRGRGAAHQLEHDGERSVGRRPAGPRMELAGRLGRHRLRDDRRQRRADRRASGRALSRTRDLEPLGGGAPVAGLRAGRRHRRRAMGTRGTSRRRRRAATT